MKIRTRLWLLVLLPTLFGMLGLMTYTWKSRQLNLAEHEKRVSDTIIRHVLELELLLHDFIRHPDQAYILDQWMQKHKSVDIFLSGAEVSEQNREAFEKLHNIFIELRQLLTDKIWKLRSAKVTGEKKFQTTDRIFDVMLMTSHQLVMESLALGKTTSRHAEMMRSETDRFILLSAVGMTLLLFLVAFFIGRRVLSSMALLKTGSQIIGTGDLTYRLAELGEDEFGDLGRSFNAMTEKLRHITASRDELNREISERKEAEKDLKKSQAELQDQEAYLRKVLDSQSSIVIISENGNLIDANKAFFAFLPQYDSVKSFQKEHRCICELFEPVERPGFLTAQMGEMHWIEVLRQEPDTLHKAMIRNNGTPHVFTVRHETIGIQSASHDIITFSDITELEWYQLLLEQRVTEEVEKRRNKEMQMLQQSRIAQMGEMITNISHHWRQPLNLIGLNVQELKDAQEYGELTSEHLNQVVVQTMEALSKMSATLDRFREFTAAKPEKALFSIADAVSRVVELIRPELESHFIQITLRLDETLQLYGDKNILSRILYNVLNNAQEVLTERDSVKKEITVVLAKTSQQSGEIVVSDTGGGIEEAIMARIFDPFFTTKERTNKTGTGLYFAKNLIESELGGTISAANTAEGASFALELPLKNGNDTLQPKEG